MLAGMVFASCRRCWSADSLTGSGWVPWLTCGSCCGSPRRRVVLPAEAQAIVLVSENWPASSITIKSRAKSLISGAAKVQEVPPIT